MEKHTVLIIEDEEPLRVLYSTILENANINTVTASTGKEGLDLALKYHPDLLLVDVMLPDISGHEVVTKLRLDTWGKTATVIYLTNRSDAESVVAAVEQGSDEYIIKSHIDNHELLNRVRSAMMR